MFCCNCTNSSEELVSRRKQLPKENAAFYAQSSVLGLCLVIMRDFLSLCLDLERCHSARAGSQLLSCKATTKTRGVTKGQNRSYR